MIILNAVKKIVTSGVKIDLLKIVSGMGGLILGMFVWWLMLFFDDFRALSKSYEEHKQWAAEKNQILVNLTEKIDDLSDKVDDESKEIKEKLNDLFFVVNSSLDRKNSKEGSK